MSSEQSSTEFSWDKLAHVFFGPHAKVTTIVCGLTIAAAFFTYFQTRDTDNTTKHTAWAVGLGLFIAVVIFLLIFGLLSNHFRGLSIKRKREIKKLTDSSATLTNQLSRMKTESRKRVRNLQLFQARLEEVKKYLKQSNSGQSTSDPDLGFAYREVNSLLDRISKEIAEAETLYAEMLGGIEILDSPKPSDYYTREPQGRLNE
ncbi:MAG: hypothetical protein J0L70_19000 [Leptolyngbya sp. UWPOB_LEPTO1]|uniref:hypothetical protein n=1 Tax=Leptolyngbya sp. UWPOB_LEPTO1 TaxID=2815653 RepID=UPI001AC988FC|nr:hypothetical protein [Leptolyngbya sp. UWPOB_LEPTO1]MBN8562627.1 hypothetical protein [Leptolyngbya sp. UWPOB_LEPTO1]